MIDNCGLLCGWWELNTGFLEEEPVLLTTSPDSNLDTIKSYSRKPKEFLMSHYPYLDKRTVAEGSYVAQTLRAVG